MNYWWQLQKLKALLFIGKVVLWWKTGEWFRARNYK